MNQLPKNQSFIRRLSLTEIDNLVPLFQAYLAFYQIDATSDHCRQYLTERLARNEAVVFVAVSQESIVGFTLLYTTFSSLAMKPVIVLHDLFVVATARQQGVAKQLMANVEAYAKEIGAAEITLQTAHSNTKAQSLYASNGYQKENAFYTYFKSLK